MWLVNVFVLVIGGAVMQAADNASTERGNKIAFFSGIGLVAIGIAIQYFITR